MNLQEMLDQAQKISTAIAIPASEISIASRTINDALSGKTTTAPAVQTQTANAVANNQTANSWGQLGTMIKNNAVTIGILIFAVMIIVILAKVLKK